MKDRTTRNESGHTTLTPLMTIQELATYLKMTRWSVYHMMSSITLADGKRRVCKRWRFVAKIVEARVDAGLFGRGLDANGEPITQPETKPSNSSLKASTSA